MDLLQPSPNSRSMLLSPPPLPLLSFPNELLLMIASNLSVHDLASLILTRRYLYSLLTPVLYTAGTTIRTDLEESVLHWAAETNQLVVARRLLERGADRFVQTIHSNETPLHNAVRCGHLELSKLLFEDSLMTAYDIDGKSPLHTAASFGRDDIVSFILSKHPKAISTPSIYVDMAPLHYAAMEGHPTTVALLMSLGAESDVVEMGGSTPLHLAASSGHVAVINILVDNGADVDAMDVEGQTPLYCGVERGREDVVRVLLEKGANVNAEDNCGMSPLSRACAQCCVHVNTGVVKLLIDEGANVRSKDTEGMSALHHSSREGHVEAVKLLLKGGAKARERDRSGDNALDLAEEFSRHQVIELLRHDMGMIKA